MMWILLLVEVVAGTLVYGLTFHYFQERWKCFAYNHRLGDRLLALWSGIFWPAGLIARWLLTLNDKPRTCWGLRYRSISAEESWEDHQRRWPNLSRDHWEKV